MAAEHIVALDAGTSGARCIVARPGTGIVAVARRGWCYQTPPDAGPFARSFDPEVFWATLCDVTSRGLADAGLSGSDIAAIGVTSQRLAVLVLDANGRSLYAGPNTDARAVAEGFAIDARIAERIYASTGKLPSLLLAPARLQWLHKHGTAAFDNAASVLTLGDWVAYKLTGEIASERSLAADCGLLDATNRERDAALLQKLDVPEALMPRLVSPTEVVGVITQRAADDTGLAPGTPVTIAGGDSQCALVGMGVEQPGEMGIAAGWSCPVQQVTAGPRFDVERRTWVDLHVLPDRWVVESSAADAGSMWHWWCETLLGRSDDDTLAEAASLVGQAPPGSGDVLALLGMGVMNAKAMGLHLGGVLMNTPLAVGTVGRAELLRAALENVAFTQRGNIEQAEEVSGQRAVRIAVGGGMTRTAAFPRILADVLGRPIEVAEQVDVTGLGAAILAARAVGLPEDALRATVRRIEPDPAHNDTYARSYERWRHLGKRLDDTMGELP
ncbi:MAG: FGGY family carbohydrate kinase [Dehalococcoidia bacterium]